MHKLIPGFDLRIFEKSSHAIGGKEPRKFLGAVGGFVAHKTRKGGK